MNTFLSKIIITIIAIVAVVLGILISIFLAKGITKSITVIESQGSSKLARMFSLIQLADWVSLYLAILNGVNPTTIKNIDFMKGRLAEYK